MGSDHDTSVDATRSIWMPIFQQRHRVVWGIIAASIIFLFMIQRSFELPPSLQYTLEENTQISGSCRRKLDAMDAVSDQRRAARINHIVAKNGRIPRTKLYFFDLFEPEAVCLTEERFGSNSELRFSAFGDGPKFVCGVDYLRESYQRKQASCLVYSIGSNNQIHFEIAVKRHIGCEIHTFDPTLQDAFVGDEYATFHPWGLGKDNVHLKQANTTFVTQSVESIMKKLGHTHRKIDILKIDCEGCEYDAMPPVFEAIARGNVEIDQVLIELHYKVKADLKNFFEGVDKAGFRITHKERNQWGCDGVRCVEYAFVSQSFLRRATAAAIC